MRTALIILLLALGRALAAEPTLVCTNMSVAELIDDLVNIDAPSGVDGTALVRPFIAEDQPLPEFKNGLSSSVPKISPQMRELVRRGVSSLPLLIKHLDDKRPTKLTVGGKPFTFAYFGDEYNPRNLTNQEQETNTNRFLDEKYLIPGTKHRIPDMKYTVRVGDVCYALIGQIVNRRLLPVSYRPTSVLVINSPIQEPSLAEQVTRDWANIDAKEHMASLIADAEAEGNDFSWASGLRRLRFYYPEEYRRQAAGGTLKQTIYEFESSHK